MALGNLQQPVCRYIIWSAIQRLMNESHAWERFVRQALERLYIRKEEQAGIKRIRHHSGAIRIGWPFQVNPNEWTRCVNLIVSM